MKRILTLITALAMTATVNNAVAQDLMSDTWVATDALGRVMPTAEEAGLPKTDKQRTVGIFYVTWHDENLYGASKDYRDVTETLESNPDARLNDTTGLWGPPSGAGSYHWGEPENGYFLSCDRYVIRKDLSMLTDAGVDVLILDVTNAVCYWQQWDTLFEVMTEMMKEGNQVPKVCFWTYNGAVITVTQQVYERYYKKGLYKDFWFYWDGKPLLLCNMRPELDANGGGVKNPNPNYDNRAATDPSDPHYGDADYAEPFYKDYTREVKDFFTMRNMWWGYYDWGGKRYVGTEDNWSFGYQMDDKRVAELSPLQRAATHNGRVEQMAVTPAQHPLSITGKSWRAGTGEPKLNDRDMPEKAFVPWLDKEVEHPEGYGIYFQDRWDEALQADPDFIYLNDWNEWTAGKYRIGKAPGSELPGPTTFLGRKDNTFYFVDQYNAEFNRTIQPVKGQYTDNYYMQMVENIRKYKGVREIPRNSGLRKSKPDGITDEWKDVKSYYLDTKGDTYHRDHNGYAGLRYTNDSGRNDIVEAKVTTDRKYMNFYVRTDSTMTPYTDKNWMLLLIDADHDSSTGWYGYDFIVNLEVKSDCKTTLKRYDSKLGQWTDAATIDYAVNGCEMELRVPRKLMGLTGDDVTFDFKWADNPQSLDTPISLCTDGDTAPNRRFNYRYIWQK